MNLEASKKAHQRALKTLVGGVNSPVRSFSKVGGTPLLAQRAKGAYLWDLDSNRYIDFVMSYGPHLFGHAKAEIVEAVSSATQNSSCMGFSSVAEIDWAERFLSPFPHFDYVRAMSTGTEACMTAVRLARGSTGREKILKFSGHYHGHVDSLMVDSGSGIATLSEKPVADSAGIPKGVVQDTYVLAFNDERSLEELFSRHGREIAGVIVEPIMGNMGVIPAKASFLEKLRELCTQSGSLLIFDEVMTGFRVAAGSAQSIYKIKPDLACFGKVVGGGMPLSALAGPAQVMENLAPLGSVYQAGTLSGNPVAIQAGIAMFDLIAKESPYEKLDQWAASFAAAIEKKAQRFEVPVQVQRVGSMLSVFFRKDPVSNSADSRDVDMEAFNRYFWALCEEGILIPPSPFEAYFVSQAHVEELPLELMEEKLERVFEKVQRG